MFLLIQKRQETTSQSYFSLHYNMFLLILNSSCFFYRFAYALHSNMFLLIRGQPDDTGEGRNFTFQYVSINTVMRKNSQPPEISFTFQYVSINTSLAHHPQANAHALHSNMFLLIPSEGRT